MAAKQKKAKQGGNPALNAKDRVIDAAFALATQQDWNFISIRDIADEAGIGLAEFYDIFSSKDDIITAYGEELDRKVLNAFSDPDPEASVRDRLFDLLMERFDLANQKRAALVSILKSLNYDPKTAISGLPHLSCSMAKMLEAAGIDSNGARGAIRVLGLTAVCAWVTRVWMRDETADLTQTMAELDKALNRVESIANTVNL